MTHQPLEFGRLNTHLMNLLRHLPILIPLHLPNNILAHLVAHRQYGPILIIIHHTRILCIGLYDLLTAPIGGLPLDNSAIEPSRDEVFVGAGP